VRIRKALAVVVAVGLLLCPAAAANRPSRSRLVTCADESFKLSALGGPLGAETGSSAPAKALRSFFRSSIAPPPRMMARHHWRLLRTTRHRALFGLGEPPDMQTVLVVRHAGAWKWRGWAGGCHLRTVRDGVVSSPWRLDPAFAAPDSSALKLHILVRERSCSDSSDAHARVQRPAIWRGRERISIATYIKPDPDGGRCSWAPETPITVSFDAPLADRRLVDVGAVPWHLRG
jgi:hypothetical protein